MALLGDLDHVRQMLNPVQGWTSGSDVDARLAHIQLAVTAMLEERCGRTWGDAGADTSRLYWVGASDTLLLNPPARSVTSITLGGDVVGSTMTGGTTYPAADLVNLLVDEDGWVLGIGHEAVWSGGIGWWGTGYWDAGRGRYAVLVTGRFADASQDIPDDLQYAADYLISERFKQEAASPSGFQAADGTTVPIRDPWRDPMVKDVLARYARPVLVSF